MRVHVRSSANACPRVLLDRRTHTRTRGVDKRMSGIRTPTDAKKDDLSAYAPRL